MPDLAALLLGLALAAVGGELFVRGAIGLAVWLRVPAGVIGATVAAFATSSPELVVSVTAATAGQPQIALGDALGSNVTNVGLILGLAAVIGPISAERAVVRRDFLVALAAPVVTALFILDSQLARWEAAVLLAGFVAWITAVALRARHERSATGAVLGERSRWGAMSASLGGLVCLITAGQLIVLAAKAIGAELGMDPFVVGATLVAVGTSTPELATTVLARLRGHTDVGVGTVIGSNVFNGLFIVAVAALITPIDVPVGEVATGLLFGIVVVAASLSRRGLISRPRGVMLLLTYVGYVCALLVFPVEPS